MRLGKVIGKIWATQKITGLKGKKLLIVRPLADESLEPAGRDIIAVDTVRAGSGDLVFWVSSREAGVPLPNPFNPVDATIVGIIDHFNPPNPMHSEVSDADHPCQ